MKQEITQKQWDELNDTQKDKYLLIFKERYSGGANTPSDISTDLPNIGRMIEFLGDDNYPRVLCEEWGDSVDLPKDYIGIPVDEICDKLWEATKSKLKI